MTLEQRTALDRLNLDYEEVLERFADNEELFIKCLHKFAANNPYDGLIKALEDRNVSDAFEAAHSLKGVSGNLGFKRLYSVIKEITEVFRAGSLEVSPEDMAELKDSYIEVLQVINSL
ncbi:MAG: Hpt domain-containing protein [Lachnospiraceae bacterium]|nr:Hpt domain-containing protein [Lachnospiraceae bacterium]